MADDKDSERPLHSDPDEGAIDEPTTTSSQEADETAWMMKEGITLGLIAIGAMIALGIGLMQATGLVDFFGQIGAGGPVEWVTLGVLVIAGIALFAWSRMGV